jgi:hypothetical protein
MSEVEVLPGSVVVVIDGEERHVNPNFSEADAAESVIS